MHNTPYLDCSSGEGKGEAHASVAIIGDKSVDHVSPTAPSVGANKWSVPSSPSHAIYNTGYLPMNCGTAERSKTIKPEIDNVDFEYDTLEGSMKTKSLTGSCNVYGIGVDVDGTYDLSGNSLNNKRPVSGIYNHLETSEHNADHNMEGSKCNTIQAESNEALDYLSDAQNLTYDLIP